MLGFGTFPLPERAAAQEAAPAPNLVDALARCLEIRDDSRRLACSDAAGRDLVDATRRKDVVVVDRAEVKATRRSLFGFTLPRIGLFGKGGPDKAEEVNQVEGQIAAVSTLPYGRLSFTMKDDARWSTTEAWAGTIQPRAGDTLLIRRGTLGGYFVQLKGGRVTRALRTG